MNLQKGYAKDDIIDVNASIDKLEDHIENFPAEMKKLSSEDLLSRQGEGKWSKKEILGHLIDSAINNLKRFTEIQFLPQPFTVISYNQVNLIVVNDYQNLPLEHLLDLWRSLNKQIVYVVRNIDDGKLDYPVDPQYENAELKTLSWIIIDYVAHMEHHFKQIFPKG